MDVEHRAGDPEYIADVWVSVHTVRRAAFRNGSGGIPLASLHVSCRLVDRLSPCIGRWTVALLGLALAFATSLPATVPSITRSPALALARPFPLQGPFPSNPRPSTRPAVRGPASRLHPCISLAKSTHRPSPWARRPAVASLARPFPTGQQYRPSTLAPDPTNGLAKRPCACYTFSTGSERPSNRSKPP